jgi:hypothetical protein
LVETASSPKLALTWQVKISQGSHPLLLIIWPKEGRRGEGCCYYLVFNESVYLPTLREGCEIYVGECCKML